MLRITLKSNDDKLRLKLEGRLVGIWVHELWDVVLHTDLGRGRLEVDIRDLTFADDEGERALLWLHRMGAEFLGGGSLSDYLCERLGIPLCLGRLIRGKGHTNAADARQNTNRSKKERTEG